jgi:hypothetical protein
MAVLRDYLGAELWGSHEWSSAVAVLLISGEAVALVATSGSEQSSSSAPTTVDSVAIQEWWSAAQDHSTELEDSLDDSQRALDRLDGSGFEAACQQMHDVGQVKLHAFMPTPHPELTAELQAVIEDAHTAAHMCLSAAAGSIHNYDGEFMGYVDQADKQMKAAETLSTGP